MATETPPTIPTAPDLSAVPNFGALGGWIERLQSWCNAAAKRLKECDELEANAADLEAKLRERINDLEADLSEVTERQDDFNELVLWVADVERRVRTGPELFDHMRRKGWT